MNPLGPVQDMTGAGRRRGTRRGGMRGGEGMEAQTWLQEPFLPMQPGPSLDSTGFYWVGTVWGDMKVLD